MRRRRKEIGDDEEEDNDEEMFRTNFQQALKQHSKGTNNSSLEKQIEYFGNAIEPFNMR